MTWGDVADAHPPYPERPPVDPEQARRRWTSRSIDGGHVTSPVGWWALLDDLACRLDAVWPAWQATGVTQDDGRLRVQLHGVPADKRDVVTVLVEAAEREAAATCEVCGWCDPVEVRGHLLPSSGRARALCSGCHPRLAWADVVGPAYTPLQIAWLLNLTTKGVAANAGLLALEQPGGQIVYPTWQLDDGRLLPGIAEVVEVLGPVVATTWTIAGWLRSPQPDLGDAIPYELLVDGDVGTVVAAAERFAADLDR